MHETITPVDRHLVHRGSSGVRKGVVIIRTPGTRAICDAVTQLPPPADRHLVHRGSSGVGMRDSTTRMSWTCVRRDALGARQRLPRTTVDLLKDDHRTEIELGDLSIPSEQRPQAGNIEEQGSRMVTDCRAVAAPRPICGVRYPASRHRVQSDVAEHGGQLAIVNHLHRIKREPKRCPEVSWRRLNRRAYEPSASRHPLERSPRVASTTRWM